MKVHDSRYVMINRTISVYLHPQDPESMILEKYQLTLLPFHTTDDVKELIWYNSEDHDLIPACLTLISDQGTFSPLSVSVKLDELLSNGDDMIDFHVHVDKTKKSAELPPLRFADLLIEIDSQVVGLREPMTCTAGILKETLLTHAHRKPLDVASISLFYAGDPARPLEDEQSLDQVCGIDLPPYESLKFVAIVSNKEKGYYQLGSHEIDLDNLIVVDRSGLQPYALVNSRFFATEAALPNLRVKLEILDTLPNVEEQDLTRSTASQNGNSLRQLFRQLASEAGSRLWRLARQSAVSRFYKIILHLFVVALIWGVVFLSDLVALPSILHWPLFFVFLLEVVFNDSALQNIDDFVALDIGYNPGQPITSEMRKWKLRIYSVLDGITLRAVRFGMGTHAENVQQGVWMQRGGSCVRAGVLCLVTVIPRGHHIYNQELLKRIMVGAGATEVHR